VRSARRSTTRAAAALLACALPLAGLASGCQTTQETATLRRAEAKRILAARKHGKQHARQGGSHHGRVGGRQQ
jgi:hypothetical protein